MEGKAGSAICTLAVIAFVLPAVTFLMPEQVDAEYVEQDVQPVSGEIMLVDDSDDSSDPEDDDTDEPFTFVVIDAQDMVSSGIFRDGLCLGSDIAVPL